MAGNEHKSESEILRQKAESLLNKRASKPETVLSEIDLLKLIHELEVHQIELEMQNHELNLAHERAKEAIEKYTELYDFAPVGYFTLTSEGEIQGLNLNGAKMLGKGRFLLKYKRFVNFVSHDSQQTFNQFLGNIFQTLKKETCEIELQGQGNTTVFVLASGVVSENGKECFLMVIDISERKLSEQELRKLGKQNTMAQQMGHTGSWEYEIEDDKMKGSEEMYKIFGLPWDSAHFTLNRIEDCIPDRELVHRAMVGLIKNDSVYNLEFVIHPADGSDPKTVLSIAQLERDGKGKPIRVLGFVQDITASVKIKEELELKNKLLTRAMAEKDKFFSIIAHDLRSPFNGFLGLTQLLVEDLPTLDQGQIKQMALLLRNSATNVFSLVENLLEWSRIQRGLIVFSPERFSLEEKVKRILGTVLESAGKKEIETLLNIPEGLYLFADLNMFSSTLRNLVSNAVKFTPKGGKIILTARPIDLTTIEISVKDSGIGMKEALLKKLFDLTEQTNRLGTDGELSSGLGLFLCKEFVEKNGGKLWVESEEKVGSTFYFTTPMREEI